MTAVQVSIHPKPGDKPEAQVFCDSMGVLRASIRIPVDGGTVPIIFDSPHDAKVWAARALAALDTAWNESWGADELVSAS